MSALLSTFKGQIEKEQGAMVEPIPKIDYIVGNFLDNLGVVQSTEQPKQNYGEEMLMLNNYMDNKVNTFSQEPISSFTSEPADAPTPIRYEIPLANYEFIQTSRTNSLNPENSADAYHKIGQDSLHSFQSIDSHMDHHSLSHSSRDHRFYAPSNQGSDYGMTSGQYSFDSSFIAPLQYNQFIPHDYHQFEEKSGSSATYQCNIGNCRKQFPKQSTLDAHKLGHSTNTSNRSKQYMCELCPQAFSRSHGNLYIKLDLKRHQYIHSRDKPFTCPRCGRGFSRRDALKRHEKSLAEGKKVHCVPLSLNR
jgi:curved DNA-binding protein CbpA